MALSIGALIPTFWLLFAIGYSGRSEWLTRRRLTLLAVDPIVFATLLFTNPHHGLVWIDATLVGPPTERVLDLSLNVGYFVHIDYAYAVVAIGIVVDTSDVARGAFDPEPIVGSSITEFVPDGDGSVAAALSGIDGQTITTTAGDRQRAYDVDCSTLTDHRERVAGYVVSLRDVTDRQNYEERLEVTQRILRHNLRNDMNVIRE